MSDTPRTDAAERKWSGLSNFHSICVDSDFARQLERELAEARADAERLARLLSENHKWHLDYDKDNYSNSWLYQNNTRVLAAHDALKEKL